MELLERIMPRASVAGGLAILSIAVTLGLILGSIRIRGVNLGVSAVLFSSLALGAFGLTVSDDVLLFLRDFALILFVFIIGLQVGPGFVSSLRADGLFLNLAALCVTASGAVLTGVIVVAVGLPRDSASGLYTGAFATTPGLAAAQEAVRDSFRGTSRQSQTSDVARAVGLSYAVTYPFGLLGP
ncbi:MAG: putative transporter, partial [Tepidisphaeraceae bacterium]